MGGLFTNRKGRAAGVGVLAWNISRTWDARNTDALISGLVASCGMGGIVIAGLLFKDLIETQFRSPMVIAAALFTSRITGLIHNTLSKSAPSLVLPLYVPTLIFGAEAVRRGADGLDATGALMLMGGITAGCFALLPFATAATLRINLR